MKCFLPGILCDRNYQENIQLDVQLKFPLTKKVFIKSLLLFYLLSLLKNSWPTGLYLIFLDLTEVCILQKIKRSFQLC